MQKVFKLGLFACLLSILSYLIYMAVIIALADISHYPVKNILAKKSESISEKAAQTAQQKISTSIKLRPGNAEYREYLGRIYYLRALNNQADPTKYRQYLDLAYQEHHRATQLRPQWPYSWANMALIKSRLQQYDVVFLYSVQQAIEYGPWEISSNQGLVQAIFSGWDHMSTQIQQRGINALERIYQQDRQAARTLLKHYQLSLEVCPKISNDKLRADKVCHT